MVQPKTLNTMVEPTFYEKMEISLNKKHMHNKPFPNKHGTIGIFLT
jgi:hypothetical protein